MHPVPDFSPSAMSSSSAKHGGTKHRKNRRDSSVIPAGPGEVTASEACIHFLPSTSSVALPLQAATAGSSPNEGCSLLEATAPLSEGMEKEEMQTEHCGESVHSMAMAAGVAPTAHEVVDLTGDSAESVVVDLTHNDSVMIVEENREWQNRELSQQVPECLILSSDDDSEHKESNVCVASKWQRDLVNDGCADSKPSGTVSCPICLDGYSEIVYSGRLIVSTTCGHIFCSRCLCDSLRNSSSCPTCRKKINHKQYHTIYI